MISPSLSFRLAIVLWYVHYGYPETAASFHMQCSKPTLLLSTLIEFLHKQLNGHDLILWSAICQNCAYICILQYIFNGVREGAEGGVWLTISEMLPLLLQIQVKEL